MQSEMQIMNMYIDSNNFYKNAIQLLGSDRVKFNWGSLVLGIRDIIQADYPSKFSKANYYSALSEEADSPTKYAGQKKFLDAIDRIPYIDVHIGRLSKVPRHEGVPINLGDPSTYKHIEKNTDINISNDMLSDMFTGGTDIFLLCSADGDFANTIQRIKDKNKTVLALTPSGSRSITVRNVIGDQYMYYVDEAFLSKYIVK